MSKQKNKLKNTYLAHNLKIQFLRVRTSPQTETLPQANTCKDLTKKSPSMVTSSQTQQGFFLQGFQPKLTTQVSEPDFQQLYDKLQNLPTSENMPNKDITWSMRQHLVLKSIAAI
jgi:hypothetical protein